MVELGSAAAALVPQVLVLQVLVLQVLLVVGTAAQGGSSYPSSYRQEGGTPLKQEETPRGKIRQNKTLFGPDIFDIGPMPVNEHPMSD
jgi:hypothetical protein